MQTPAEKKLIEKSIFFLRDHCQKEKEPARIINIGAGKSLVVEDAFSEAGIDYICDRTDMARHEIKHPARGETFVCSVEAMPEVKNNRYLLAFSNYVLEHVSDLPKAAGEIYRIIKPGGIFVVSAPNPRAPEFVLSKLTPLWFHQLIKGKGRLQEAHETFYSYKNIKEFVSFFAHAGFKKEEINYYPFTLGYLYRFPILNFLSLIYDKIISLLRLKIFMGQVCLVFKKD